MKGEYDMTLQQMKYAITIYETGNFSRAAEKLYVTQPSLTKAINELEREIGTSIFERRKSGVVVTEEGEEFITHARQLYSQYDCLHDRFILKQNVRKKFAVSCQHYSFALRAFSETVRSFDISEYDFAFREGYTKDVINDVTTKRSEIGIIYLSDFNERFIRKMLEDESIVFDELIKCSPCVFLCRNNPLAQKESLSFEDIKDHPCLVFEQGASDPYFFGEELLPLQKYSRIIKAHDKLTMLTLIAELDGYTLSSGMIYDKLNQNEYTAIPFIADNEHPASEVTIGYITRKDSVLSEVGKLYIRNIKEVLK